MNAVVVVLAVEQGVLLLVTLVHAVLAWRTLRTERQRVNARTLRGLPSLNASSLAPSGRARGRRRGLRCGRKESVSQREQQSEHRMLFDADSMDRKSEHRSDVDEQQPQAADREHHDHQKPPHQSMAVLPNAVSGERTPPAVHPRVAEVALADKATRHTMQPSLVLSDDDAVRVSPFDTPPRGRRFVVRSLYHPSARAHRLQALRRRAARLAAQAQLQEEQEEQQEQQERHDVSIRQVRGLPHKAVLHTRCHV
eukprot:TRINITY_DN66784_c3_g3_i1.p2 TRINITY_DN66784_c3_g3~~TRINITY_DN66784_c3_g3_i1.p2  ORF type:complete len:286 (-),score=79.72 TRINITY_DN66784_c3_g3_i1:1136-1894(-)